MNWRPFIALWNLKFSGREQRRKTSIAGLFVGKFDADVTAQGPKSKATTAGYRISLSSKASESLFGNLASTALTDLILRTGRAYSAA
jgi:hypothetical protein